MQRETFKVIILYELIEIDTEKFKYETVMISKFKWIVHSNYIFLIFGIILVQMLQDAYLN